MVYFEPYLLPALFGLIGVVVGGMISFGVQYYFLLREEKKKSEYLAKSILFKLKFICDNLFSLSQTIRKSLPDKPRGLLSDHMRGVAGIDRTAIDFTIEEIAALKGKGAISVQQFLQLTSSRGKVLCETMQVYSDLRAGHQSELSKISEIDPSSQYQKTILNSRTHQVQILEMMQLNSLAFEIVDMFNEFFESIAENSEALNKTLKLSSGLSNINFKLPDREMSISVEGYSRVVSDLAI